MTTTRYRGFDIVARPYQLSDTGRWTVDFDIRRSGQGRSFSLRETHATETEAKAQCLILGRRIVEGRVNGWSVQDLRAEFRPIEAVIQLVTTESLTVLIVGLMAILWYSGLAMLREVR
jgi:hypothetical protein